MVTGDATLDRMQPQTLPHGMSGVDHNKSSSSRSSNNDHSNGSGGGDVGSDTRNITGWQTSRRPGHPNGIVRRRTGGGGEGGIEGGAGVSSLNNSNGNGSMPAASAAATAAAITSGRESPSATIRTSAAGLVELGKLHEFASWGGSSPAASGTAVPAPAPRTESATATATQLVSTLAEASPGQGGRGGGGGAEGGDGDGSRERWGLVESSDGGGVDVGESGASAKVRET